MGPSYRMDPHGPQSISLIDFDLRVWTKMKYCGPTLLFFKNLLNHIKNMIFCTFFINTIILKPKNLTLRYLE